MKVSNLLLPIRIFHCILAVIIPTITAIIAALIIWPLTNSKRKALNQLTKIIGDMGCYFAGIKLTILGTNNIYTNRPAVFIFNHQSGVDPVIIAKLIRSDVVGIANIKFKNHPIFGFLLRLTDAIFIDSKSSRNSVAKAMRSLQSGLSVAVAPEGTRTSGQVLGPFRSGAFIMAAKLNIPIVPIVVSGTKNILPPGSMVMKPGTVSIHLLAPRYVADNETSIEQCMQTCFEEMRDILIRDNMDAPISRLNAA